MDIGAVRLVVLHKLREDKNPPVYMRICRYIEHCLVRVVYRWSAEKERMK